jgi:hypothetical protein
MGAALVRRLRDPREVDVAGFLRESAAEMLANDKAFLPEQGERIGRLEAQRRERLEPLPKLIFSGYAGLMANHPSPGASANFAKLLLYQWTRAAMMV